MIVAHVVHCIPMVALYAYQHYAVHHQNWLPYTYMTYVRYTAACRIHHRRVHDVDSTTKRDSYFKNGR